MQHLTYADYLAFLGSAPSNNRLQILQQLLPHMDKDARQFWLTINVRFSKGSYIKAQWKS